MTPQEKAEQLYNKFLSALPHPETTNAAVYSIAKMCAIIAVDEIINSVVVTNLSVAENQFLYWEQVKQEIESI
jgi:hypothetical protein